jgi:hypothetical protein
MQYRFVDTIVFPPLPVVNAQLALMKEVSAPAGSHAHAAETQLFQGLQHMINSGDALSTLPPILDDFVGRTFDCWAVIQHLERRRLVVVSAEPGAE